jgi:hypothetical protein
MEFRLEQHPANKAMDGMDATTYMLIRLYSSILVVEEIKNTIIALGLSGQVNFGADEPRIVSTCRSTGSCCAPVLLICRIRRSLPRFDSDG